MIKLVLSEIVEAIEARSRTALPTLSVTGVSTDSRTIRPGELFFAIPGENFDGHDFVVPALRAGAAAVVIASSRASQVASAVSVTADLPRGAPLLFVDDTVAALGRLARFHRKQTSAQVIAIVGSNGKTTTKAMIAHILAARAKGRASPKSFNNSIGVPLTLLSAEFGDEFLAVEIGTNAPGEIAQLAAIALPDLAVLTSIGEEHLEKLRDLDGVAAEECSVLEFVQPGGFAAVIADAPQTRAQLPREGVTLARFGWHESADLRITATNYDPPWLNFELNGRFRYRMPVLGAHNAVNAAGAIAIARRMGMEHGEIAARLESFKLPPMRGEMFELGGARWINDAYNSNPASAKAAIETIEVMPCDGRRIAVIGEMRELGTRSAELHVRLAERLAHSRIDHVLLVGAAAELMRPGFASNGRGGPQVATCATLDEAADRLAVEVAPRDLVLLKASRAIGLERLLGMLNERLQNTTVA